MNQDHPVAACIDVGSGALTMLIAQLYEDKIHVLDTLRRGVDLGRDCYATGAIRRETMAEVVEALRGFMKVAGEYGAQHVSAASTSAVREAANRDYVLEQIRQATGLRVRALPNAMERYITYKALGGGVANYQRMRREGMLIVDVGYGSTEITAFREGAMVMSRNVPLGALRLWELLSSIAAGNPQYPDMLEQLIISDLDHIRQIVKLKDIPHAVVLSGEADQLKRLAGGRVTRKRFDQLYMDIKNLSTEQLQRQFDIRPERGEILLPTMMVIRAFMDMTGAEALHLSEVSLADGMLIEARDALIHPDRPDAQEEDILSTARELALSHHCEPKHTEATEQSAMALFDALSVAQGLGARERLLLRLSVILHDSGKSISSLNRGDQAALIIRSSGLIGLTDAELAMVGIIAAHQAAMKLQWDAQDRATLSRAQRVVTAKLLAIFNLANAMDKGHTQRLRLTHAELKEGVLVIFATCRHSPALEKWAFAQKAPFFEEVYGLGAQLTVKQVGANG